jgi:hypothetical protein
MKLPALIKKAENDFDVPSFPSTRTQSNLMGFYYRKSVNLGPFAGEIMENSASMLLSVILRNFEANTTPA